MDSALQKFWETERERKENFAALWSMQCMAEACAALGAGRIHEGALLMKQANVWNEEVERLKGLNYG